MIALNILLAIPAAILFVGVLGERDRERHFNITLAFVAVVALIIVINTLP